MPLIHRFAARIMSLFMDSASSSSTTTIPDHTSAHSSIAIDEMEFLTIPSYEHHLIDPRRAASAAVNEIFDGFRNQSLKIPPLYIDLEGNNLGRYGTADVMQIHHLPLQKTYIFDLTTLGSTAFNTRGYKRRTLKTILESKEIPKVFWDVRNDSDALYSHFDIELQGVQDLQLMELASRTGDKDRIIGLGTAIDRDLPMPDEQRDSCSAIKNEGRRLLDEDNSIFSHRPMSADIIKYCVQDVKVLPQLWEHYNRRLSRSWRKRVLAASRARVSESKSPEFDPQGPWKFKIMAPSGWEFIGMPGTPYHTDGDFDCGCYRCQRDAVDDSGW